MPARQSNSVFFRISAASPSAVPPNVMRPVRSKGSTVMVVWRVSLPPTTICVASCSVGFALRRRS
jgi:hypothetical protein